MAVVDWARLSRAIAHWVDLGYGYIDAPWRVSPAFIRATLDPSDPSLLDRDFYEGTRDHRCPVGSGEQSMLSMLYSGTHGRTMQGGKFVTCTPCFRDDEVDWLHQKEFMKVEIMRNDDVSLRTVHDMIEDALCFFADETGCQGELRVVGMSSGRDAAYDIELDGIEIGSYGIRQWMGSRWVYGTGLAEPRFSTVLQASALQPS